jgi:hypothetical protein
MQKHYCLPALDMENAASTHWLRIPVSGWSAPFEKNSVEQECGGNLATQTRSILIS